MLAGAFWWRAGPGSAAGAGRGEAAAVDAHVRMLEVRVCLSSKRGDVLAVVGTREALVVPDDVAQRDVIAAAQPTHELQAGAHLRAVGEHLLVAEADVLNADCGPVEPYGVPAHHAQGDRLVDAAGAVDHEVRASIGQLVQLGVGYV